MTGVDQISFEIEKSLLAEGWEIIAGIDEAGRGSLAGPLVVGIVIYTKDVFCNPPAEIRLINDSKSLTRIQREKAFGIVANHSVFFSKYIISHQIIDTLNINGATELAVNRLIESAKPVPDAVIMDGNFRFSTAVPFYSVIKGDKKSFSIASASIVAKESRDNIMRKYHAMYPYYGFDKNMGYGTKQHIDSVRKYGHCRIHRKSYEPVRSIVSYEQLFTE